LFCIAEEDLFHFTTMCPRLGKDCVHMLSKLGSMIGTILEAPHSMMSQVANATRAPIKLLGSKEQRVL
jgi:hypothetical protein